MVQIKEAYGNGTIEGVIWELPVPTLIRDFLRDVQEVES